MEQKQKELVTLQNNLLEASRQYQQVVTIMHLNEREKKKGQIALEELNAFPESSKSYKAVGRAFMLEPLPKLKEKLSRQIQKCEKEISKQKNKSQFLEKKVKGYENQMAVIIGTLRKQ
eukprot:TRINITY_DN3763_c0_g1_i1.p1 TRINITY_DN3763_c0_g1~~TRINITY_DN3763_c0_g1_i1.p1  ORF type:complete len:118 (+),score=29.32 TRINITY_DN3763_c0_g1_i1:143-496(+)